MKRIDFRGWIGVLAVLAASCGTDHGGIANKDVNEAAERLTQAHPGVQIVRSASQVSSVFGPALAGGATARDAADAFIGQNAVLFGVGAAEVKPDPDATVIPVKYDLKTATYAFSLVRYAQHRDDIRVFASDVGVLVRNEPGNPVVLVTSRVKPVGAFAPTLRGRRLGAIDAGIEARAAVTRPDFIAQANTAARATFSTITSPEAVIWAGSDDHPEPAKLAVSYVAESPGDASTPPKRLRFVADIETGAVLHSENLIVFEDVSGTVHGLGTPGDKAPQCSTDASLGFPYAKVAITGGNSGFATSTGAYTLTTAGATPVTITSSIAGQYFAVNDSVATRNSILSQQVTPPASVDFTHDPEPVEFLRAQVNGYSNSNQVRDWLIAHHPDYPVIAGQMSFPVVVNRADGFCPGNAWYDGVSINFCSAGSTFANTSFASVNHHEYGHHIVSSGGSGQSAYGEGMADTIAVLIADDPGLAYGFVAATCGTPLRTADNTCQLSVSCSTCGSESHDCGRLLSGSVWSVRNLLKQSRPSDYLELLANLTINSVLLHKGTDITNQILVDFLTLDDDDGDLNNGTPHRSEICSGFQAHGFTCPPLLVGLNETSTPFLPKGDPGGPFAPPSGTYNLHNYGPSSIDFAVTTDAPWLSIDKAGGALSVGADSVVTVSVNAGANALGLGVYTGTLHFVNATNHVGDKDEVVKLTVGGPKLQLAFNMDQKPNWNAQGQWEWGKPQGLAGDPTTGFTGDNVFGYNLAGAFPPNLPETHLTTTAIDCSQLSKVSLKFRRWLCVETASFDHAYVRVSNDGVNWTTIFQNPFTTIQDTSWQLQDFDISAVADGKPTVFVRWTMGTTDSVVQGCGWNVDDVEIWGIGGKACTANADCDDHSFCNGIETCVSGKCSQGQPPNCNDSVACTTDTCVDSTQSCSHTTNDLVCGNGLFCDGIERCDAVTGCSPGTPPCSNLCDESSDRCVQCLNDAQCGDGAFCNGAERCVGGACTSGVPPCNDGVACTSDACNESNDTCLFTPNDALCSDGLFCDGAEKCFASGCSAGAPPCAAGATCNETTDSCCAPESDAAFCARIGKTCGTVSGADNCGIARTVASCGSCTAPDTCGGAGVANVCGGGNVDRTEGGTVTATGTACNTATETPVKAYDNLMTSGNFSKWCVTSTPTASAPVSTMYDFAGTTAFAINRYTITTANDNPTRDPRDWTLQGCQGTCSVGSATGWVTLDTRTGQFGGAARFQTNSYAFSNTTPYQQYRVRVTANNGATNNRLQIMEIQMFGPTGCSAETNTAFCSRLGKNCGSVTAPDNCGTPRTVSSCGSCTASQTCGGGGTANVCGSTGGGNCSAALWSSSTTYASGNIVTADCQVSTTGTVCFSNVGALYAWRCDFPTFCNLRPGSNQSGWWSAWTQVQRCN